MGAIQDYDKAIEINPKYAEAYFNRGSAYLEQGDPIVAIQDYDMAIALDPKFAAAYVNRGYARNAQGDFPGRHPGLR